MSENSAPTQLRTREELSHLWSRKEVTLSHFTPRPQFPLGSKGCFLCVSICLRLFSATLPLLLSDNRTTLVSCKTFILKSESLLLCVCEGCLWVWVSVGVPKSAVPCVCAVRVEGREELVGGSSPCPPCGYWESNLGHQAWQTTPHQAIPPAPLSLSIYTFKFPPWRCYDYGISMFIECIWCFSEEVVSFIFPVVSPAPATL